MGRAAPHLTDGYDDLLDAAFAEDAPGQPKNTKAITISHDGKLVAERYADGVSPAPPLIGWSMAKSFGGGRSCKRSAMANGFG